MKDENFYNSTRPSVIRSLKSNIRLLRADKQPLAIFGNYGLIPFLKKLQVKLTTKKVSRTKLNEDKKDVLATMLEISKPNLMKVPNSEITNNKFNELKENIDKLLLNNNKIIFFEMPVNHGLINLPKPQFIRKKLIETFPSSKFKRIDMEKNKNYITSDGTHLTEVEALEYTLYFRKQVKQILDSK